MFWVQSLPIPSLHSWLTAVICILSLRFLKSSVSFFVVIAGFLIFSSKPLLRLLPTGCTRSIISESFTPGIICSLHTFGRSLKWNPHIHMIVSEGAAGNVTVWKAFNFFPYVMLRKKWQTIVEITQWSRCREYPWAPAGPARLPARCRHAEARSRNPSETDPLSWRMSYDFPEGIGPKDCYLMYHEELESLVQNIRGLNAFLFQAILCTPMRYVLSLYIWKVWSFR